MKDWNALFVVILVLFTTEIVFGGYGLWEEIVDTEPLTPMIITLTHSINRMTHPPRI